MDDWLTIWTFEVRLFKWDNANDCGAFMNQQTIMDCNDIIIMCWPHATVCWNDYVYFKKRTYQYMWMTFEGHSAASETLNDKNIYICILSDEIVN